MTEERVYELLLSEINPFNWERKSGGWWSYFLPEIFSKELEEYLIEELNLIIKTSSTIQKTETRLLGPKLYNIEIRSDKDPSIFENYIEGVRILIPKISGERISVYASDLAGLSYFRNNLILEYTRRHERKIEDLIEEIGEEEDNYKTTIEKLKELGLIP